MSVTRKVISDITIGTSCTSTCEVRCASKDGARTAPSMYRYTQSTIDVQPVVNS